MFLPHMLSVQRLLLQNSTLEELCFQFPFVSQLDNSILAYKLRLLRSWSIPRNTTRHHMLYNRNGFYLQH
jgi:hypothetical protein